LAAQSPNTHEHSFSDAKNWAQVFDDPKRDATQKPHEVIMALALKPDGTEGALKSAAELVVAQVWALWPEAFPALS